MLFIIITIGFPIAALLAAQQYVHTDQDALYKRMSPVTVALAVNVTNDYKKRAYQFGTLSMILVSKIYLHI